MAHLRVTRLSCFSFLFFLFVLDVICGATRFLLSRKLVGDSGFGKFSCQHTHTQTHLQFFTSLV